MAQVSTMRKRMPSYSEAAVPLARTPQLKPKITPDSMLSQANQDEFRKIEEWWLQARESQSFVRLEMDVDDSFYHGDQFTAEDRQALEDVGQAALVFNKIHPIVDWLAGTERRTRVDFNILPRKKGFEDQAQMKKDVMKYISDTSKIPFTKSDAFKEAAISGLSWIEACVRQHNEDEPIYVGHESWRNIWYDPLGTKKDTSDWRYLFRSKWTDLDIGQAMFPDYKEALQSHANSVNIDLTTKDDDEYYVGLRFSARDRAGNQIGLPSYTDVVNTQVNNRRERIRLVECWYRVPMNGKKVKGGRHHGRIVNVRNQRMMWELNKEMADGTSVVYDAVVMRVKCAVFCENTLLQNMDSPYHHNRFPFIPVFAYRKGKFHEPYGVVRNARDPQEDLNKRYSKALFLLSSTRIIADRNAVQDWEAIRSEVARPDAQLLLDKPGAKFDIHTEQVLVEEHVKLMHNDGVHIMEGAGVTAENMGRDSNSLSGKAVLAKQSQGSVVTAELFDNLRYSDQLLGEIVLSLAEQFIDQEKAVRITGEKGQINWRDVNTKQPDGTVLNDITATQMDYVVTEQDYRDSMRQAMFESLSDMVSKMAPEVALNLLDVIVDMTDFPGKQALIDRIRKVNGQMPPENEMTPEQKKEAQAAQAQQQQAAQQKQQAIMLDLREKAAKCSKLEAEAKAKLADIGQGDGGAAVAGLQNQLRDVQEKASIAKVKYEGKIATLTQQMANHSQEITSKTSEVLAKAHMDNVAKLEASKIAAAAQVESASIHAASNVEIGLDELSREIDSLEGELKMANTKAKEKKSLAKKPAAKKK